MRFLLILLLLGGCDGPAGADGVEGRPGVPGPAGPTIQGPTGENGAVGPRGPRGETGPPGEPGTVDVGVPNSPDCPELSLPPGLGGVSDSEVTQGRADAWLDYRAAREQERLWEAYRPEGVLASYRMEQEVIDSGCVSEAQLIDLGRALFLRSFSLAEGFGNGLESVDGTMAGDRPPPNMRRFQQGRFGGPDATGCFNCHWKGGFAGAGDRADNAFLFGDGDDVDSHDQRNPPSLWGAGWTEIIAREMTVELRTQVDGAIATSRAERRNVIVNLEAKGVPFGIATAAFEADEVTVDLSGVEGVDQDLVIKPFGWRGTSPTLRDFAASSLHFHLNLQSEELVAGALEGDGAQLGEGPNSDDPDNDGVVREFTEGQLTALVLFLATLDTPGVHVPTQGGFIPGVFTSELEVVDSQEFTVRWLEGANVFQDIGCSGCHKPLMAVSDPVYRTTPALSGIPYEVDLSEGSARPRPARGEDGLWMVPAFSDFKRHRMGEHLAGVHADNGVEADTYLTRRLWGVANTRPYLHDGRAANFDEAIAAHAGEGSEAAGPAQAFSELSEGRKASLRVFLLSLRRAPAIRVR